MLKAKENAQRRLAVEPVAATDPAERRLLFISHANPQDNQAAAWFATQLTLMGYEVWCDIKNTHAGESSFWLKVQKKIENDAAKFIFILSDTSRDFEKKPGVYKEVQAADNCKRDNFIMPLRVEKLKGSVPILISPDLYIPSENWAEGLRELHKRLVNDGIPRPHKPDYEKIASWWPAVSARDAIVRDEPADLFSNVLPFSALPQNVHFLAVSSEGNRLRERDQFKGALPAFPPYSVHGGYAVSFANAVDYMQLTHGFDIASERVMPTEDFLREGCPELSILPQAAQNMVTYLVATAVEKFLADKGLSSKSVRLSRRKIWFPPHSLLNNNNYSFSESGGRKGPVKFVGKVSHFRKTYYWHFAVQPTIDLHTHGGILLSPKAIITRPYHPARGEKPMPLDEKRVLKKLGWWNNDWRMKVVALASWLADGTDSIRIPTGYQQIALSAVPETFTADLSYLEKDDDEVMKEIIRGTDA
jgi:hypothetical protein